MFHISSDLDLRTIKVRKGGSRSWVEFRSNDSYGTTAWDSSQAALLHDTLEGWHACILHAGDTIHLLPRHSDYTAVAKLMEC